ncbi:MAG: CSLREA domain-containing protein [Gammaproteobacteria bacterium]|jgi:CSLREA domain-containing protein
MKLKTNSGPYTIVRTALLAASLIGLGVNPPAANALVGINNIQVTTTNDTVDVATDGVCADAAGQCSLRAAIQTANELGGSVYITLGATTYTLTLTGAGELFSATGDLNINNASVTITSPYGQATIKGGTGWDDRLIQVGGSAQLSISNVVLTGGNSPANGGAIWGADTSSLILRNSRVTDNQAASFGGGISGEGLSLFVENSRIDNNTSGAQGGGILAHAASNTISTSTIDHNTADSSGGVYAYPPPTGSVDIVQSTISNNTARYNGGGIQAVQNVNFYSTTITGNTAAASGTSGYGGGIYLVNTANIRNSIVAGNMASYFVTTTISSPDCYSPNPGTVFLASQGYNLIGDMTGCTMDASGLGEQLGDATNPIDPLFGPLQDNGGVTPTHLLLTGSPGIDTGNPNGCVGTTGTELTTDQRGYTRPIDGDADGVAVCDLGAVEITPTVSAAASTSGGGGGGGCTISNGTGIDPTLPGLLLAALAYLGWRRKHRT